MAWSSPVPSGGYDHDFVDPPPDSLTCSVCLMPFRDPHMVDCCGAKYCESCIGRVKAASQPCPLCKQPFNSMVDRSKLRKVLSLKVRCSRKRDGCEWEGELRHLDEHEGESCDWALVRCQCGGRFPRRKLSEHELRECPQRPMDFVMDLSLHQVETKLTIEKDRHEREMAALREELKKQMEQQKKEFEFKLEQLKREVEEEIVPRVVPRVVESMRGNYCFHSTQSNTLNVLYF